MERASALISGASSGLGWQYALQLAERRSHDLLLVARRGERLTQLKEEIERRWRESSGTEPTPEVAVRVCDLCDRQQRQKLCRQIEKEQRPVNFLINNAGFGSLGPFVESDLEWEQRMVELNCIAPVALSRHFAPSMQENAGGTIINVCSTAAFNSMPYMATYGATKAFLLSFSVALACEFRASADKSAITVLAHCPGPTPTEFHLDVGLEKKMDFLPFESADKVVRDALRAAERNAAVKINGKLNWLIAQLNRCLPRRTAARSVEGALRQTAGQVRRNR